MIYKIDEDTAKDIADAIREKTGRSAQILGSNAADEIRSIKVGGTDFWFNNIVFMDSFNKSDINEGTLVLASISERKGYYSLFLKCGNKTFEGEADLSKFINSINMVKTVNNTSPDANGNIQIDIPELVTGNDFWFNNIHYTEGANIDTENLTEGDLNLVKDEGVYYETLYPSFEMAGEEVLTVSFDAASRMFFLVTRFTKDVDPKVVGLGPEDAFGGACVVIEGPSLNPDKDVHRSKLYGGTALTYTHLYVWAADNLLELNSRQKTPSVRDDVPESNEWQWKRSDNAGDFILAMHSTFVYSNPNLVDWEYNSISTLKGPIPGQIWEYNWYNRYGLINLYGSHKASQNTTKGASGEDINSSNRWRRLISDIYTYKLYLQGSTRKYEGIANYTSLIQSIFNFIMPRLSALGNTVASFSDSLKEMATTVNQWEAKITTNTNDITTINTNLTSLDERVKELEKHPGSTFKVDDVLSDSF